MGAETLAHGWIKLAPFPLMFLGLGGTLLGLVHLLAGSGLGRWGTVLDLGLALVLAGGAAGAALLGQPQDIWLPLAALSGVCALFAAVRLPGLGRVCGAVLAQAKNPRWQGTALVLACPLLTLTWPHRHGESFAGVKDVDPPRGVNLSDLTKVASPLAYTDKGRPVHLFQGPNWDLGRNRMEEIEASFLTSKNLNQHLIRTAPPDLAYDCHGWVFGAAHYWILGGDVESILEDNGYRSVSDPKIGDVAIYRASLILHSGLVRSVGADRLVLIESKWGWIGRFVHEPRVGKEYGGDPTYYRSKRSGHTLRGLQGLSSRSTGVVQGRQGQRPKQTVALE
jgi:hypothetical protein